MDIRTFEPDPKSQKRSKKETSRLRNALAEFLKAKHPANILIPGIDATKTPKEEHKGGKWTWKEADKYAWGRVNTFGLLLKDLIVIDYDTRESLKCFQELFPCLHTCPKQTTRKGAHLFFKRTPLCNELDLYDSARGLFGTKEQGADDNGKLPVDIKTVCRLRAGQQVPTACFLVVCPSPDKDWVAGREPWTIDFPDLPDELAHALKAMKGDPARAVESRRVITSSVLPSGVQSIQEADTDRYAPPWPQFERLVRGLSISKRFDKETYPAWSSLAWAMVHVGQVGGYADKAAQLFDELSQQVPEAYSSDDVRKVLKARAEGPRLGYKRLLEFLKEDNPELYQEMRHGRNLDPLIPEERTYAAVKAKFEESWFKLSYPPMFVQLKFGTMRMMNYSGACHNAGEIVFEEEAVLPDGRKQVADVTFFGRWAKDPTHRCYDSMDFLPPPLTCPEEVYNTFPGIRAAALPAVDDERDLSPIMYLIRDLCDRNGDAATYLVRYMADMVQTPGRLPGTGIIMKSRQGRGKNTLWGSFFANKILGEGLYYSSANPDHFFGRFANGMVNKLLTNFNEIECSHTSKIMGLVKEAITEPYLNYEKKGLDVVRVHNFARQVWFSNEIMPIKIAADDRRWMAVQASDGMPETGTPEHTAYFKRVHDWMADDGNVRAFYDMLMATDLSDWNAERDRPRTSFYTDLQQLSLNRVDQWLVEQVENDTLPSRMHASVLKDAVNWGCAIQLSSKMINQMLRCYVDCQTSGIVHLKTNFRYEGRTGNGYAFDKGLLHSTLRSRGLMGADD